MSGELNIEHNGIFGDSETVMITRARLNRLVTEMVIRIAANAITDREIADGAISIAKLQSGLITTALIQDYGVTTQKIAEGAITRSKLSSVLLPQISEVYTAGAQTLTAGAAFADVTTLTITLTPGSESSRFLLMVKLSATSASGGLLSARVLDDDSAELGLSTRQIPASGADTLTFFHLASPGVSDAVTFKVQASATTNDIALVSAKSSLLVQEVI
jgi:hypothetical protein